MYIVTNAWKSSTEDVFNEGEIGNVIESHFNMVGVQFETLAQLAEKNYFPIENAWQIWDGRLQCSFLECADCTQPSGFEMEQWKQGLIKLWSVTYEFIVKRIIDVDFDVMAAEFKITNEKG